MPGGELEPIGRSGPNLAGVSTDMSEVFARAGLSEAALPPRRAPAISALRPEKGRGRALTWLAAATAGLAGLTVGALVIHVSPSAEATVGPSPPLQKAKIATAPMPVPASPAPSALPAVSSPPPLTVAEAGPPPAPVVAPAPKAATPRKAAARTRPVLVKPASVRPVLAKASRSERAVAQPASCERNASGSGCRRAVVQADRHLRDVYERAIRRGVPRAVLIDYRERWADLRESETENPIRLIQSYGALAYDLGRENRESRDDEETVQRRRNPSGFKALADLLLPWW